MFRRDKEAVVYGKTMQPKAKIRITLAKLFVLLKPFLFGVLGGYPFLVYVLLLFGVFLYIILGFSGKTESPLELAKISAIIGSLILAGSFFQGTSQEIRRGIRRVGILYLAAVIFFVLFGFYLPVAKEAVTKNVGYYVVYVVTIGSMVFGSFAFSWATALLTSLLPRLWRDE